MLTPYLMSSTAADMPVRAVQPAAILVSKR